MRAFTLLTAVLLGCGRSGGPPVPRPDRSDGALPTLRVPRCGRASLGSAPRLGGFVDPGTGRPRPGSNVQGDGSFCYDDEGLHLGVDVYDPRPEAPFDPASLDPHIWERSTGVELMLEPHAEGLNQGYFELQVDRRGAVWSTRFDGYNRPISRGADGQLRFGHQDWQPALSVQTRDLAGGRGFRVELTVRWADLDLGAGPLRPSPGAVWRANVYTFRDGQRDSLAWSPILGQGNFHRASRWGRLQF